ncbi:MAG: GTPase domain-containing protein [candidate division WOR-3 bacterium]|nr:GTPase domain-containing protein [candidate division WOR-3 bacterium]
MAVIKYASGEVICKIVYYGPGRAGKTTNVKYIYSRIAEDRKSEIVSMATKQDRTLFFDFLPLELGIFKRFNVRFQVYTVPGQVLYDSTRKLVLQGVDGLVFVADSRWDRLGDSKWSLENLWENLKENNIDIEGLPIVIEYNKRDLIDVVPVEKLEEELNPDHYPSFTSIATEGKGVIKVFKTIGIAVLKEIKKKLVE